MYSSNIILWLLVFFSIGVVFGLANELLKKGLRLAFLPDAVCQTLCSLVFYPLLFPVMVLIARKNDDFIDELAKTMVTRHNSALSLDEAKKIIIKQSVFPRVLVLWYRLLSDIHSDYNNYIKYSVDFGYSLAEIRKSSSLNGRTVGKINPLNAYIHRKSCLLEK